MEEFLGSFITHEHTFERDKKEKEEGKKKKKILLYKFYFIIKVVMMMKALVSRKFKEFLKKKAGAKKIEKNKEKAHCYDCKNYGHMKNECPNKKYENEDEQELEEVLGEICFMAQDDLQVMFEELYHDSIKIAKNKKELKKLVETLSSENDHLKNKVARLEQDYKDVTFINEELAQQVVEKDEELLKLLGGSQKLSSMLLMRKSSHCKLELG